MKEERSSKSRLVQQQKDLQKRLLNIETGCAKELVLRLKTLRDEIATVSNQKMLSVGSIGSSYAEDTVENMVKQISHRVT